ncbi:MAG TPA: LuxR C-terminal-related transcriptional regulator [Clostridia bacterium]|nr:LuxR C-terminal-related transcriptional regulator [Clostridia bacterium]
MKAVEAAQSIQYPGVLVPAMTGISRVKRSRGDLAGALSTLEECERRLQVLRKPHWNDLVGALKARYWAEAGNMDWALRWLRANKLSVFGPINRVREFELIVHARVLWATKNGYDAEMLLLRLLSFAQAENRRHSMVEVLNLLAMIACRKGSANIAAEYMERSLGIGLDEGYVRSYLDEQAPMLAALRQAMGILEEKEGVRPGLVDFAASLVSQLQREAGKPHDSAAAGGVRVKELLTEKELKVLELLCAACSNEEIGKKLNIGQRTVKAHTGNIYGKLGVKTRAQCIKLMYEAGFPPPGPPLAQ